MFYNKLILYIYIIFKISNMITKELIKEIYFRANKYLNVFENEFLGPFNIEINEIGNVLYEAYWKPEHTMKAIPEKYFTWVLDELDDLLKHYFKEYNEFKELKNRINTIKLKWAARRRRIKMMDEEYQSRYKLYLKLKEEFQSKQ